MTLHWLAASLIMANLALGFCFVLFLGSQSPHFAKIVQLHKSIGLTVLPLGVLQLGWRLIDPAPLLPKGLGRQHRALAYSMHYFLYVLTILIPLAGWARVSSLPHGLIIYFGLLAWPNLPLPRTAVLSETLAGTHGLLACGLVALLLLHVSAALWHHFSRRDDVLKRMVPGMSIGGPP